MNVDRIFLNTIIVTGTVLILATGCDHYSDRDRNEDSSMRFGSSRWEKAAAENLNVTLISVIQTPSANLTWQDDLPGMTLSVDEKRILREHKMTGKLEVISTAGRGTGTEKVRVVVVQQSQLIRKVRLLVPEKGSYIYVQKGGTLSPLFTNSPPSVLSIDVVPEPGETMYYLDYPRDRTRYGGSLFSWDKTGKPKVMW
jgi:hypothetical protein